MWKVADAIASKEGRLDVCVAAAGVLGSDPSRLEFPDDQFQSVSDGDRISRILQPTLSADATFTR